MRSPLSVFPVRQSYGLSWDTKRGFHFSFRVFRLPSGDTEQEQARLFIRETTTRAWRNGNENGLILEGNKTIL